MTQEQNTKSNAAQGSNSGSNASIAFMLDKNLGLTVDEKPWSDVLPAAGITAEASTDLAYINQVLADHKPDIAYIPCADFHRLVGKGDHHYRGLAIATSKFTAETNLPSVLVVRKDDPANGLDDLAGAKYAYINKSCSSSYFPPAILLERQGKKLDEFLQIMQTKPWQGQINAVVSKEVRVTMVPEENEIDTHRLSL